MNGKEVDEKWNDFSDISETMRLRLRALQQIESDEKFAVASNVAVYWGLMVNASIHPNLCGQS